MPYSPLSLLYEKYPYKTSRQIHKYLTRPERKRGKESWSESLSGDPEKTGKPTNLWRNWRTSTGGLIRFPQFLFFIPHYHAVGFAQMILKLFIAITYRICTSALGPLLAASDRVFLSLVNSYFSHSRYQWLWGSSLQLYLIHCGL